MKAYKANPEHKDVDKCWIKSDAADKSISAITVIANVAIIQGF